MKAELNIPEIKKELEKVAKSLRSKKIYSESASIEAILSGIRQTQEINNE